MAASAKRGAPPADKLMTLAGNIAKQVERGRVILQSLNRFAHSADRDAACAPLEDIASEIGALARRLASLRHVSVEVVVPDERLAVTTDPFLVRHALFACFDWALSACDANSTITIAVDRRPESAAISVRWQGRSEPDAAAERRAVIDLLANCLAGTVRFLSAAGGECTVELTLPRSAPEQVSIDGCEEEVCDG